MTDRPRVPEHLRTTPAAGASRSKRPAQSSKIVVAGLASTTILGLTALFGWQAGGASAGASTPTTIDPAFQAAVDQALARALLNLNATTTAASLAPTDTTGAPTTDAAATTAPVAAGTTPAATAAARAAAAAKSAPTAAKPGTTAAPVTPAPPKPTVPTTAAKPKPPPPPPTTPTTVKTKPSKP